MRELIRTVSLFNKLDDVQLDKIYALCQNKTYAPGTLLFREKEQGGAFYILLSGSVKIFTSSAGGEEKILSVINPGNSFGEMSLIDGKPRSASAQTLETCSVYIIQAVDFLNLMKDHFDITLGIMQELAQRLRNTNEHVHDLTFLDARTRVIKQLIMIANRNGTRNGTVIDVKMALNYDELSRMAGVTQKVLIEVLRDVQERSLLQFTPDGFRLDLTKIRG